jgi:hypothetical protein
MSREQSTTTVRRGFELPLTTGQVEAALGVGVGIGVVVDIGIEQELTSIPRPVSANHGFERPMPIATPIPIPTSRILRA